MFISAVVRFGFSVFFFLLFLSFFGECFSSLLSASFFGKGFLFCFCFTIVWLCVVFSLCICLCSVLFWFCASSFPLHECLVHTFHTHQHTPFPPLLTPVSRGSFMVWKIEFKKRKIYKKLKKVRACACACVWLPLECTSCVDHMPWVRECDMRARCAWMCCARACRATSSASKPC